MKTTRWTPDTCDCVLEYEWDETKSQSERTHAFKNVVKKCDAHQNSQQPYDTVKEENERKNKFYAEIIENLSTAVEEKTQEDGSVVKDFKKGKDFKWSFDENRKLIVELKGFSATEKTVARDFLSKYQNKVDIL